MQAKFKLFRSETESWETMFQKAADFMSTIGPEKTIGITTTQQSYVGIVTVWYWSDELAKPTKE